MIPVRTMRARPWSDRELAAYDTLFQEGVERLWERIRRLEIPFDIHEACRDPEKATIYVPAGNTVTVCRVPPPPLPETHGDSGIFIPDKYRDEYEREPESRGVVIWCGLEAFDTFRSHGLLPGDWVKFGRFEGWEEEIERDREGKSKKKLLQLKDAGLLGSFDLIRRLWGESPSMELVYEVDENQHGIHTYRPIVRN